MTPTPPAGHPERPWHHLQGLPRTLWLPGLIASVGQTEARLLDAARWREALLQGELPPADALMGDADALRPLRVTVGELGLPALAAGSEPMAEQVLRTLFWHLDRLVDYQPAMSRAEAIAEAEQAFRAEWQTQASGWEDVLALLQGLGDLPSLQWDAVAGQLHRREWAEAQRVSEALARMPEIVDLLRRIGRSEHAPVAAPTPSSRPEDHHEQRLLSLRVVSTRLPDAPGEITGIRFTDRIERQLPAEAAQLRHPVLHKLWRARRAEARLLGWDSEAVLVDLWPDPGAPPRVAVAPPRPDTRERGPIVLCLDTSGSMRGARETIAKAVALQALRTAHRERRGCVLVSFGGPDELIEQELTLDARGLALLLDLMGQSFDGGTDVQTPIERAIERIHRAGWRSADLLIVSDGEFGCMPATLAELDAARCQLGLRVHGVLVGDRETLGLLEVCDEIHWVRDWRRHGDDPSPAGVRPSDKQSLAARYFPNALSQRAQQRLKS